MARTPSEIIEANGNPSAFAKRIGVSAGAVALWKHRNQIPRANWPEIMNRFDGITLADLFAAEAAADALRSDAA